MCGDIWSDGQTEGERDPNTSRFGPIPGLRGSGGRGKLSGILAGDGQKDVKKLVVRPQSLSASSAGPSSESASLSRSAGQGRGGWVVLKPPCPGLTCLNRAPTWKSLGSPLLA
ncbi:uncharacterized protein LOC120638620 [Ornithorhynchus anatinus]|uniref:uncharacterized protein LOC120638620 n=1 Tax=Ornithorhynchus anatinus TaxID=9258 RepID=UPI0019D4ACB9|nr:uncharacterized protein LOC120638620 [Ornithorhynchus anatinus]